MQAKIILFTIYSGLMFFSTDEPMSLFGFLNLWGLYLFIAGFIIYKARMPKLSGTNIICASLALCGAIVFSYTFFLPNKEIMDVRLVLLTGSLLTICGTVLLSLSHLLISGFLASTYTGDTVENEVDTIDTPDHGTGIYSSDPQERYFNGASSLDIEFREPMKVGE